MAPFPARHLACVLTGIGLLSAGAQPVRLESVGARFGFSANASGAAFHQLDAAVRLDMPWSWDLGHEWWLQLQGVVSAGWLGDPGHNALIGSAGPCAVLGRREFPLTLDGGVIPTFISQPNFGTKNFGSDVQFTSFAGLNFRLIRKIQLSYRFQHMSNAGLSAHNPGLNLHMFGVSYLF